MPRIETSYKDDVRKEFDCKRPLSELGRQRHEDLAKACSRLADAFDAALPTSSRHKSVAITKLEEAFLWARRALREDSSNLE